MEFKGVLKTENKQLCIVRTQSRSIRCSLDHKFLDYKNEWIEARSLNTKSKIIVYGKTEKILFVGLDKIEEVYDIVGAGPKQQYITNGMVSHNCAEFIGSSNTLVSGKYLKELVYMEPVATDEKLKIYTQPEQGNSYILVADCSEGVGADSSALSVIDISEFPYKQVATFRDNRTPALLMPDIIVNIAKRYNEAEVLLEINSSGNEIANLIRSDLEYDNVLMVGQDKKGQVLMGGPSSTHTPGLRTTKSSKRIGCTNLKDLIENKKLIVVDFDTIAELSTFIRQNNGTFSADELCNDDTVMSLVVFAWAANQPYFESLKDTNMRSELHSLRIKQFEENAMPMIFSIATDVVDEKEIVIDYQGIHWEVVR